VTATTKPSARHRRPATNANHGQVLIRGFADYAD
jgi:hypothetical protein